MQLLGGEIYGNMEKPGREMRGINQNRGSSSSAVAASPCFMIYDGLEWNEILGGGLKHLFSSPLLGVATGSFWLGGSPNGPKIGP